MIDVLGQAGKLDPTGFSVSQHFCGVQSRVRADRVTVARDPPFVRVGVQMNRSAAVAGCEHGRRRVPPPVRNVVSVAIVDLLAADRSSSAHQTL